MAEVERHDEEAEKREEDGEVRSSPGEDEEVHSSPGEDRETRPGPNSRPSLGLVATRSNVDSVARATMRANEQGFAVIIACTVDTPPRTVRFLERLDATVVETNCPRSDDEALKRRLSEVAREAGHPGLLYHERTGTYVDFLESHAKLFDSTDYVVTTVTEPVPTDRRSDDAAWVAIPAYNEERAIGSVVERASEYADEVLVVDDGSTDRTADCARSAGATVVEHGGNEGYGAALQTAFSEAHRCGVSRLVLLDGDGQHDPDDVPALLEALRETDAEVVIGNRFADGAVSDVPLYRRAGLHAVNFLTNVSIGSLRSHSRIGDTQSGFRAFGERAIASLARDENLSDGMDASTDVLYHARERGYDVEEVGTAIAYDVEDANSQNPFLHGLVLVSNVLQTVERDHPIAILGVPGLAVALLGVTLGYATVVSLVQVNALVLGLAFVSGLLAFAGILSVFIALVLHALEPLS